MGQQHRGLMSTQQASSHGFVLLIIWERTPGLGTAFAGAGLCGGELCYQSRPRKS